MGSIETRCSHFRRRHVGRCTDSNYASSSYLLPSQSNSTNATEKLKSEREDRRVGPLRLKWIRVRLSPVLGGDGRYATASEVGLCHTPIGAGAEFLEEAEFANEI